MGMRRCDERKNVRSDCEGSDAASMIETVSDHVLAMRDGALPSKEWTWRMLCIKRNAADIGKRILNDRNGGNWMNGAWSYDEAIAF